MTMYPFIVTVLLLSLWPQCYHGHYLEWLVPRGLQKCCGDKIPNIPDCKSIDAAAFLNGSLILFSGRHYIQTKVRDSRSPQILHDQSVRSIKVWNFMESPQRAMAAEIEAAAHDGNKFVVKKGDTMYTFPTTGGSGEWLSCSQHNGLECRKGGRGLEAMARFYGNDNVKYFITYRQKAKVEKDGQTYEVSVKRGPKEWRSYHLNDESDTVDAMAVYKVRRTSPDLAKVSKEDGSGVINYAVYFNTHGYACFFELTGEELDSKSFYKIERPAITPGVPMADCVPLNVFFGCPQSWCYRNDVDDMIVTQTMDDLGTNRESIIVYRGHYYWTASVDSGVPIFPSSARQQHLAMASGSGSGDALSTLWYIDAAEAMSVETHDFILYFIEDKLMLYKGHFGYDPEVHTDGKYKEDKAIGYEQVNFQESQIYENDLNSDLFPGKQCSIVDTAWYNKFEQVLYLFCGSHFQAYETSYNRKEGIPIFVLKKLGGNGISKIGDYFEGLPSDLDGSLMIKDKVYFTKEQYYYDFEVTINKEPFHKPLKQKLAFGSRKRANGTIPDRSTGLFATQQRCGYSDDTMSKIRTRFGEAEARIPGDKKGVGQLRFHSAKDSSKGDWPQRTAIIGAIVGIVGVIGLIGVGYMGYRIKEKKDQAYTQEVVQM